MGFFPVLLHDHAKALDLPPATDLLLRHPVLLHILAASLPGIIIPRSLPQAVGGTIVPQDHTHAHTTETHADYDVDFPRIPLSSLRHVVTIYERRIL